MSYISEQKNRGYCKAAIPSVCNRLLFLAAFFVIPWNFNEAKAQRLVDKHIPTSKLVLAGDSSLTSNDDWYVLVFSSRKCGFCLKLFADFQAVSLPDNAKVIFVERDTDHDDILVRKEYYRGSEVRLDLNKKSTVKLFPTIHLINPNNRRTKFKGYKPDRWQQIEKNILRKSKK